MAASTSCTLCGNVGSLRLPSARGSVNQRQQARATSTARRTMKGGLLSQSLARGSALRGILLQRVGRQEVRRVSRSRGSQILAGQAVAEVQYVLSGEDAKKLVDDDGYTIVDIRDQVQYERSHIPTAVHIPYFIKNEDNDIGTIVNRQLHYGFSGLFYGLAFTKENPAFASTVANQFPKDSKLLLVCNEGLRSGYAAEKLEEQGYQNLAYLTTGLQKVEPGIFPKVGKAELKDGGKGGLVTIQGTFSLVLGAILVLAFLYLQFFPDQANELFFKT